MNSTVVRAAVPGDLPAVLQAYNEGIEDGEATLETDPKSFDDITSWWKDHDDRYPVLVASREAHILGWASLNRFSHRCAHQGIADLSIYVAREQRGRGIGTLLLGRLEERAKLRGFHKIVLHALNDNEAGKRLYRGCGFSEVGIFKAHGLRNGRYVDVVAMEKLLR